ncbi:MAG TPA: N-acetylglucosamine-6-phosphate deacetylase [Methylomusa anaerophila]|uniref:N-acetylglucosamine-6-phosphate deacetylase n=1 Tax=Methylomusa anaerophila TaxID=1930071 RepID=A0A348ANH9_9FIRM|nr:N-acetylglucosamine-6-phosphate deacetylase [Methylomusa anaerophila]BBB92627.1 N-acetylglucosamine-6-phosphate deacetylase [Methylomusa anaerophila]HML87519.1 N-acetylglucosamine-6-phosphate deacetylase [Methylomusa anaerophila]
MRAIHNAKIITETGLIENSAVVYTEKIAAVVPDTSLDCYQLREKIDAEGNYLAPGFIDLHIHGCAGMDTMDEEDSALDVLSKSLAQTGVTAFLPTTMTMRFDLVENALARIRGKMGQSPGAEILGSHLEGPFISKEHKGAQDPQYILEPDYSRIDRFADVIKIVTIAPEMYGSLEFIQKARRDNIIIAAGHSAATYDQAMAAIAAGASHITHTFNAFTAFDHRQPGMLGALTDSSVTCELIADNIHVHPAAQRLLLKLKGVEKLILITDAMRACLMPDGIYDLGGQRVNVKSGAARLNSGVIAGSVLTLNKAVANFRATSRLSLSEIVKMVTINPARKLGIDCCKGSIAPGMDADMVVFDEAVNVLLTLVRGRIVYQKAMS